MAIEWNSGGDLLSYSHYKVFKDAANKQSQRYNAYLVHLMNHFVKDRVDSQYPLCISCYQLVNTLSMYD